MGTGITAFSDPLVGVAVRLVEDLFGACVPDFAVRFWDNSVWRPPNATSAPRYTLILRHPGALRIMLSANNLRLGEAYIYDGVDIEGEIESVFTLADALLGSHWSLPEKLRLARLVSHLPVWEVPRERLRSSRLQGQPHSVARDSHAIAHHYDVSNEFYRLWLDEGMVYSCAYFEKGQEESGHCPVAQGGLYLPQAEASRGGTPT